MAQHTPGPWITDNGHKDTRIGVQVWDTNHGWIIADVVDDMHDNSTANAALIVQAPAMLAALTDLLDWYDMDEGDLRPLMNAARVVIAAAEGGAAHVHSFSIWHDRQDRPARGYSRCACGVEPGDDWAEETALRTD